MKRYVLGPDGRYGIINDNADSAGRPVKYKRLPGSHLFPRPLDERILFLQGIQVGFDGSLLRDGAEVYVLGGGGVRRVDYFHGLVDGVPMCPMEEDEADVSATQMINISKGFTALRITNLQRRWRSLLLASATRRY